MTRAGLALLLVACGGEPAWRTAAPQGPELVGVWYTVQSGDTVARIAKAHRVPSADIIELNGLVNPDRLEPGQLLFLFGVDEVIDRLPEAKVKPKGSAPSFAWPLTKGVVSSGFGKRGRRMHKGLDIAVKTGTPVLAAAAGTVVYSDDKQRGYGNLVILSHAHGYVTVYAHNRRNLVDEGDAVRQGAPIAEVGSTGRSTGPHLHFEIRQKKKAVDPLIHLPAR
jgi:lipoprotein NlpD